MKTLSRGQGLLAQVAASFRANPASWCAGWGVGPDGTNYGSGPQPSAAVLAALSPCCIDVRLMQLAPLHGGRRALRAARRLLYDHLGGARKRESIWQWNDSSELTAAQVVAMLEAAAGVAVVPNAEVERLLRAFQTADTPHLATKEPELLAA